ncbi:HAD family hydrolase [Pontibacter sp. G13]|uniref:D-glycero-alpha-D-manno-heptose-1,7-bisphosphate 7-phosphatase n=1 Tax=Pontibacter sp. G13 TaxID=3074898 RepID=UPI00288C4CB0|nr:HAD family hydrolase [Pontibacter sp. G13]WNJ19001.1 HAD family hydrolase [Pontibacter sp. G13]
MTTPKTGYSITEQIPDFLRQVDPSWTLFLDRDGVINVRLMDDYVKQIAEFEFLPGSLEAMVRFGEWFGKMVVVTNQRGIDKGLMTTEDLKSIHAYMEANLNAAGGHLDGIYFCPYHPENDHQGCRKPKIGMALEAQEDFPEIDFQKSIMVGDSISDMEFGRNAGMHTVFIHPDEEKYSQQPQIDCVLPDLGALMKLIEHLHRN